MKYITLTCPVCSKEFQRTVTLYNSNIKRGRTNCCSTKCASSLGGPQSKEVQCTNCGKQFSKRQSQIKRSKSGNHFCSKTCSVSYNNVTRNKKKKSKVINKKQLPKYLTMTKKELFSYYNNWQTARNQIRKHAVKTYNESNKPKYCHICGYSHHYDVAHIKSVSSFSDNSKLQDINNIDNLIALCPNHHWEYDNSILKLN